MTDIDVQALKDVAKQRYDKDGKYHVIVTNYITDMFNRYDELISKGYRRAPDAFLTASNINIAAMQVIHMEKPLDMQIRELRAIYNKIDNDNGTASYGDDFISGCNC